MSLILDHNILFLHDITLGPVNITHLDHYQTAICYCGLVISWYQLKAIFQGITPSPYIYLTDTPVLTSNGC